MTATKTLVRYKNPWHDGTGNYGPAFFETDVRPREYRGFLIYNVWAERFDIVKDGVCLTQRAGDRNHGLNQVIDGIISGDEQRARAILDQYLALPK